MAEEKLFIQARDSPGAGVLWENYVPMEPLTCLLKKMGQMALSVAVREVQPLDTVICYHLQFMMENHTMELEEKLHPRKSHVLSKFMALCWAAFIAVLKCVCLGRRP